MLFPGVLALLSHFAQFILFELSFWRILQLYARSNMGSTIKRHDFEFSIFSAELNFITAKSLAPVAAARHCFNRSCTFSGPSGDANRAV